MPESTQTHDDLSHAADLRGNRRTRRRRHSSLRSGKHRRRNTTYSLAAITAAAASACLLATPMAVSTPIQLTATYLVGPTETPPINVYTDDELIAIAGPYVAAVTGGPLDEPIKRIDYPAAFIPISGPFNLMSRDKSLKIGRAQLNQDVDPNDEAPVFFGYSQGASVIGLYKQDFNAQYADAEVAPTPTFIQIGNNRANGGFFQRFEGAYLPILGITFEPSAPTETAGANNAGQVTTFDYARQYDFFADFPNRPTNLVALLNAVFGLALHADYTSVDPNTDAVYQDRVGDTQYYLFPTERVPLLLPLQLIGVADPILAVLDAPLRVLIEAGYDRTISPGEPTTAMLRPVADPLATTTNFLQAIVVGMDDGLELLGQGRPFGTQPSGAYGVGGPPVTLPGAPEPTAAPTISAAAAESARTQTTLSADAHRSAIVTSALGSPPAALQDIPSEQAVGQPATGSADQSDDLKQAGSGDAVTAGPSELSRPNFAKSAESLRDRFIAHLADDNTQTTASDHEKEPPTGSVKQKSRSDSDQNKKSARNLLKNLR